jgi:formylglycine-generating enzyme required for sulfatase activity
MGPSDEDINYNLSARNREISIMGFWMDATEITNNEYRQFVNWTRDSLAAVQLGYFKQGTEGDTAIDWKKAAT